MVGTTNMAVPAGVVVKELVTVRGRAALEAPETRSVAAPCAPGGLLVKLKCLVVAGGGAPMAGKTRTIIAMITIKKSFFIEKNSFPLLVAV